MTSLDFVGWTDDDFLEEAGYLISALGLENDANNPYDEWGYYAVQAGGWRVNGILYQFCFGRVNPDGQTGGFAVTSVSFPHYSLFPMTCSTYYPFPNLAMWRNYH